MHKKTLVLNSAYYPINVVGWRVAMAYLFDTDNIVLETYSDEVINTISHTFNLPAVIVVDSSVYKRRGLKFSSSKLMIRDNYTCSYCGKKFNRSDLNIDHVIPKSKGGKTTWLNCVTSCIKCNSKKKDRTPEEAEMPLLTKPFIPRYDYEYFLKWNGDVCAEWEPYLPKKKKPSELVVEVIPTLKFGRKVRH